VVRGQLEVGKPHCSVGKKPKPRFLLSEEWSTVGDCGARMPWYSGIVGLGSVETGITKCMAQKGYYQLSPSRRNPKGSDVKGGEQIQGHLRAVCILPDPPN